MADWAESKLGVGKLRESIFLCATTSNASSKLVQCTEILDQLDQTLGGAAVVHKLAHQASTSTHR